jgi:hypothetical protein
MNKLASSGTMLVYLALMRINYNKIVLFRMWLIKKINNCILTPGGRIYNLRYIVPVCHVTGLFPDGSCDMYDSARTDDEMSSLLIL